MEFCVLSEILWLTILFFVMLVQTQFITVHNKGFIHYSFVVTCLMISVLILSYLYCRMLLSFFIHIYVFLTVYSLERCLVGYMYLLTLLPSHPLMDDVTGELGELM